MTYRSLTAAFVMSSLLGGCTYRDHDGHASAGGGDGGSSYVTDDPNVYLETVATGVTLTDILPGEETGVFIDYVEDGVHGSWGVYVSCDVLISGVPCLWDIVATPHYGYVGAEGDLLELNDGVYWYDMGVQLLTETNDDLDGIIIDTDAGVPVRFDVLLDDESGQRYVYWADRAPVDDVPVVRGGAPSNPIDLQPL